MVSKTNQVHLITLTYKTKHNVLVSLHELQNKTQQRRAVLFARSQKSQYKYNVSKGLSGMETFSNN